MDRIVLHSDLNNFFASVECVLDPSLKGKAIAVCGDPSARHGIVLAKSEEAKKFGVKTAETIWQAKKKCPPLELVGTHFLEYRKYSELVKQIYLRYTDYVESFSIDECWLDVTESTFLFGSGYEIAERIRSEVYTELGLTVSIGVSFNKSMAKMASDMKKPNAVTVLSRDDFKERLYSLPVGNLLYVGRSTEDTLSKYNVKTIGEFARLDESFVNRILGKAGLSILACANGTECERVRKFDEAEDVKSIGNSFTLPDDVIDINEIYRCLFVLSESVAERLMESGAGKATTVHLIVKDKNFASYTWQMKVKPTFLCSDIHRYACELFERRYTSKTPVRLLGVSVSGFSYGVDQLVFDDEGRNTEKEERAEKAFLELKKKYGINTMQRGSIYKNSSLSMHVRKINDDKED